MLSSEDVCCFAKTQMIHVLGDDIPQVFLAGGAYKSLIHHKPPRDLDIWAETEHSRQMLIKRLRGRGAEIAPSAGAQRFVVNDVLIDVSFQIERMEERLKRFDIGMSSIAVAFREGQMTSWIHPKALLSIRERTIHLIQCHQRLVLATLVRARRYAHDLNYQLLPDVERPCFARSKI